MIDPRAIIDPDARLGTGVTVGPFSIIESGVVIGDNSWIGPHVIIKSDTHIGKDNKIFQFSSLGEAPQHVAFDGRDQKLIIGDRNIIRENCTISRGTPELASGTVIGDDNFIMAYAHIAHDCVVGDHTIFANGASLAGHVTVGDYAILGGFTLVHQYCKVGAHSITGIGAVCLKDVPPYIVAAGNTARPHGINVKGLRRRDFSSEVIATLRRAYRDLYRSELSVNKAVSQLEKKYQTCGPVQELVRFVNHSSRGIIR